jgi:hypothetical protein
MKNIFFVTIFLGILSFCISSCSAQKMEKVSLSANDPNNLYKLNIMGNKNASVSISQGKGVRLDGTKNPHSWSIMDNQDCLDWILKAVQ